LYRLISRKYTIVGVVVLRLPNASRTKIQPVATHVSRTPTSILLFTRSMRFHRELVRIELYVVFFFRFQWYGTGKRLRADRIVLRETERRSVQTERARTKHYQRKSTTPIPARVYGLFEIVLHVGLNKPTHSCFSRSTETIYWQ